MFPVNSLVGLLGLAFVAQLALGFVVAGNEPHTGSLLDSPALRIISDEDQENMRQIKRHISNEYSDFKSLNEVHDFLDKVKLLVQKHPKNVAFAQDDLKELHKFLSQEVVTRLVRVDVDPFLVSAVDERPLIAQRAVDEDELTRKLFGVPLRSLIEARKQLRPHDSNHKDGNFFTSFWCKISGGCNQ